MPRAIHTLVAETERAYGREGTAVLAARIRAKAARLRTLRECPTALALAERFDTTIVRTPAMDLLDAELQECLAAASGRLIVSVPPQSGKSTLARWAILRALVDDPDRRIVLASYAVSLARLSGRIVRSLVETHSESLGVSVDREHRDASDWQIDGHLGGLYACGVGGSLTGRPADCLSGGVLLSTPQGVVSARDLYRATSESTQRVLSYNHAAGRCEYRRVIAARELPSRRCVEVVTTAGRVIRCTADHRFHTSDGYRSAALLRPGDRLAVAKMFGVRTLNRSTRQVPNVSAVLYGSPGINVFSAELHQLREDFPAHACRAREEGPTWTNEQVLLSALRLGVVIRTRSWETVPTVRRSDPERQWSEILRCTLSGRGAPTKTNETVPGLSNGLHPEREQNRPLLAGVCEQDTFHTYDWYGELPLPGRHQLRRLVPQDASVDFGTGLRQVRGVWASPRADTVYQGWCTQGAQFTTYSSYRRGSPEQQTGEFDYCLQNVSWDTSQISDDTVSMVRGVRGPSEPVYDFQVEGNSNFFAGEVLVHNCLFIDDPLRGYQDADSDTIRRNLHDWWESVARTRLAPGAPVVVIATRWHGDDLSGRLVGEGWPVVNIPALADGKVPDALGRSGGVWLESTRGTTVAEWEATRRDVGERVFAALYQGAPSPPGGGIFLQEWFDRDRVPQRPAGNPPVVVVDPADNLGTGDEAGIIVMSTDAAQRIYLGPDYSGHMTTARWVRVALLAVVKHQGAALAYEQSLSGLDRSVRDGWRLLRKQAVILRRLGADGPVDPDVLAWAVAELAHPDDPPDTWDTYQRELIELWPLVGEVLSYPDTGPSIRRIVAKGSKQLRAQLVAPLYENRRVSHVGNLAELEFQQTTWQPGQDSPDRMDAATHACLLGSGASTAELVKPQGGLPTRSTRAQRTRSTVIPRSTLVRR